jgi:diguanylate cyclase (GGDEF)-like protein
MFARHPFQFQEANLLSSAPDAAPGPQRWSLASDRGAYQHPYSEAAAANLNRSTVQADDLPAHRYHRLVGYLGQFALTGVQVADLYEKAAKLITQELDILSCEFLEVLSDKDTLSSVSYITTLPSLEAEQTRLSPSTLCSVLQDVQADLQPHPDPGSPSSLLFQLKATTFLLLIPGEAHPIGIAILTVGSELSVEHRDLNVLQDIARVLGTAIERKRSEVLLLTQTKVLQAIATETDFYETLTYLCRLLEQQNPGLFCSILLLDPASNQLRSGAAPSLPKGYADALDGLIIGECAGSCGTAAYGGKPVFVSDIATDPLWENFRDLALSYDIRACWSMPFVSQDGTVLGTFALSHTIPCEPTERHHRIMETAAHLASIATQRYYATRKLEQLALYDNLTGLVNRTFFTDYLTTRLAQNQSVSSSSAACSARPFAVLFLDLDRFKLVNDSFGHIVGDQLLVELTKRIFPCLDFKDVFARLGGDEFAILLNEAEDVADIQTVVQNILASLKKAFALEFCDVFVSASIGIVHVTGQYADPKDLLRDADTAMYQAKYRSQGGDYVFFDEPMHTMVRSRLQTEIELRQEVDTLLSGRAPNFFLVYQPIVNLTTGQLIGFEVLLRWHHPTRGAISPSEFISVAEETELIVPMDNWVLETACQQLHQWRQQCPQAEDLTLSINVSGKQILRSDWISKIEATLQKNHLPPAALRLEITEGVLIETANMVADRFRHLKTLGINLSLDDFGTGYSSLSYLQAFPVDVLKIDRSFVAKLTDNHQSIVQTIISLAHNLGMTVIAEGVETIKQLQQLANLNCDFCQGFLFARPLTADKVTQVIEQKTLAPIVNSTNEPPLT